MVFSLTTSPPLDKSQRQVNNAKEGDVHHVTRDDTSNKLYGAVRHTGEGVDGVECNGIPCPEVRRTGDGDTTGRKKYEYVLKCTIVNNAPLWLELATGCTIDDKENSAQDTEPVKDVRLQYA